MIHRPHIEDDENMRTEPPAARSVLDQQVASSCTGEAAGARPRARPGPDSTPPRPMARCFWGYPLPGCPAFSSEPMVSPISIPQPPRSSTQIPGPTLTMVTPTTREGDKKTGQELFMDQAVGKGREVSQETHHSKTPKACEQGMGPRPHTQRSGDPLGRISEIDPKNRSAQAHMPSKRQTGL